MANMVIPNEGKIKLLDWAMCVNSGGVEDFSLFLYTNNYTPVDTSTLADFTAATFTGGAAISITRASLPTPTISSNIAITTRATSPSWTNTGGTTETAYGWVLKSATSGKVIAAQKFDTARTMSPGATETLDPFQFSLKTFA